MDFIKNIGDTFESVMIQDGIFTQENGGIRLIEENIKSLQKNLIESIQNYAVAPLLIERTQKGIDELKAMDTTDMTKEEVTNIKGAIAQNTIQLTQNIAQQQRYDEDIAYYQAVISSWNKILTKLPN